MSSVIELRVTSVRSCDEKWAIFAGVPLKRDSFKSKSARHVVLVSTSVEFLPMEPVAGQHWRITGEMSKRKAERNGFKYTELVFKKPSRCEVTLPHDGEEFIQFIASEKEFAGIGEIKARELWSYFGKSVFAILENQDKDALLPVLTNHAAESLIAGFEKYANLRFAQWFSDHGIPPQIQRRLFKFHKRDSVETIKSNPYMLVDFGMSFHKTDNLVKKHFEVERLDERRLVAAVEDSMRNMTSDGGHTMASHKDLIKRVRKRFPHDDVGPQAMEAAHKRFVLKINEDTGAYHNLPVYLMERVVAKRLIRQKQNEVIWNSSHDAAIRYAKENLPYSLTEKQLEAVKVSLQNTVSAITGGAGTGKTTVLLTVLRAYQKLGFEIKGIALSGRAAMRLQESIGFQTSTIAKFLKDDPNKLSPKTIIVIDEASMVDISTMYRIVLHTKASAHTLFVGDPDQLPPIGAGLVLSDIVKSGAIPTTELDIVQRQDEMSGIPGYALSVRNGEVPGELSSGNVYFYETQNEKVAQVCTDLYCVEPEKSQVLTATKVMSGEINDDCQWKLNPDNPELTFVYGDERYRVHLRLGDPVLFTKNNYDADVQNGSLGTLVSVEQSDAHYGQVELDTGRMIDLTMPLLESLVSGYAITLHKAQGSQFNRVIVALSKTSMIDRSWLYTAITRSEQEIYLVGTRENLLRAITSESAHNRRMTYLSNLLQLEAASDGRAQAG